MYDIQAPEMQAAPPPLRKRINWARVVVPPLAILLLLLSPFVGSLAGQLSSVTENDQAAFLPDSAESTRSLALETRFAGTRTSPR
jgi:RND superfamily putative drug exporter